MIQPGDSQPFGGVEKHSGVWIVIERHHDTLFEAHCRKSGGRMARDWKRAFARVTASSKSEVIKKLLVKRDNKLDRLS